MTRLKPDVALEINLNGTAARLVRESVPFDEAVEQLRTIAGGRTDLLSRAAGSKVGGYLAQLTPADTLKSAAMLACAGTDWSDVVEAADRTRRLASGSAYSDPGSQANHTHRADH